MRDEARRDLCFAGLLTLSGLIHPYFVLMNGCIWTGDLLRRALSGLRSRKFAVLGQLAARAGAVAGFAAAVFWSAGVLNGDYQNGGDGFGLYAMPLDGLFNPFRPDFSSFIPARPAAPSQLYEGFQYLGAGLLFLVLAAALALAAPAARRRLKTMGWLLWLAPGLLFLAALALSDQVQLHGGVVLNLRYDWLPFDLAADFRASGRLFWPCTYVLLLGAMELVFSLPVALALAVAVAALLLQVFDLPGFAKANRLWTAEADRPHVWTRASSPSWDRLVTASDLVQFVPPNPHVDDKLFYEVAWRASSIGRPVNIMYTSRIRPAQRAIESADRLSFLSGEVDPRRLYVLTDGCGPPPAAASRLRTLDGVLVIPPSGAETAPGLQPAPSPPGFPIGRTVLLTSQAAEYRCLLGRDWGAPEPWGVWSDGEAPELLVRLTAPPARDLAATLVARGFPGDRQAATLIVNGRPLARLRLKTEPQSYRVRIPQSLAARPLLQLVLKIDAPISPHQLGMSNDGRRLGLGLTSVRLDALPPEPGSE